MERKKRLLVCFIILINSLFAVHINAQVDSLYWPREVAINKVVTTLYEPQLESYDNNILQGRMAVSYKNEKQDMMFGALWFKATLSTDLDSRTVDLVDINISKVVFPGISETDLSEYKNDLKLKIEASSLSMSLDRLIANLRDVENKKTLNDDNIKNDAPKIFFKTKPTILITIDGAPSFKEDTQNKMEFVQNTPFFIVREKGSNTLYMKGGDWWFTSTSVTDGWKNVAKVPKNISKYAEKMQPKSADGSASTSTSTKTKTDQNVIPEVIVSTTPAELIVTDGAPNYATVEGTNLLYVKNTESDVIEDISTQEHYILLAGRWYHSKSLGSTSWAFCKPTELPADFAKIPANSDIKDVRTSIPGTPEAQDALLEQSIPQTAAVKRNEATVTVTYDGLPKFEQIAGTQITYAVNTSKTVLFAQNRYYCVDQGIWFVSNSPTGPWAVADKRPDGVDNIPAESPVNNVKYVYIYDSTPDVVYVGYLPGYNYSYVYDGVVVYGSGYYYNPWYGPYYYPRPFTWGFGVYYNPWMGWGFGFAWGWMGWGFHPWYGGYFGPAGYRYGYRGGFYNGYRHGYTRGYARGRYDAYHRSHNVYSGRHGVTPRINNAGNRSFIRPTRRANNVVTDRSGKVFQQDHSGKWNDVSRSNVRNAAQNKSETRNGLESRASNVDRSQLNKTMESRSRGEANYNNFRQSSRSFGGGGRQMQMGGGGRGRR